MSKTFGLWCLYKCFVFTGHHITWSTKLLKGPGLYRMQDELPDRLTLAADINHEHATEYWHRYENPIISNEIYSALLHAKNGKAVRVDGIPIEALRNQTTVKYMLSLFNECYNMGVIPSAWTKGIINPIPKKACAQSKDPLDCRGIALPSAIYKLFCGVLSSRLKLWANQNNLLCDKQNGFRAVGNCIENLSTFK